MVVKFDLGYSLLRKGVISFIYDDVYAFVTKSGLEIDKGIIDATQFGRLQFAQKVSGCRIFRDGDWMVFDADDVHGDEGPKNKGWLGIGVECRGKIVA